MFRWHVLVLFVLALSACATPSKHPEGGYGEPLLWTLTDEDTKVHLFGTIHALPADLDWRSEKFEAAYGASDTFCVETDVDGKGDEYREYIRQEGYFENGEKLSDFLTEEQAADLFEISEVIGIRPDLINTMKPWNAMFDISLGVALHLGLDQLSGVEFVLLPESRAKGKTICEMESPLETVTSISRLPLETQLKVLTHEKEEFEDVEDLDVTFDMMQDDLDKMVDEWLRGDLAAMEDEDIMDAYGDIDFYNAILKNRNENWIPHIVALLDEPGEKFVAVGAAHLAGPDSLVKMLRDKGYVVEGP